MLCLYRLVYSGHFAICGLLELTYSTWHDFSWFIHVAQVSILFFVYLAAESCPTLCDPMDCRPPGSLSMGFSRQEYWSGLPLSPPGDLPDPGIEPRSPTLQADSLPSELNLVLYCEASRSNAMAGSLELE